MNSSFYGTNTNNNNNDDSNIDDLDQQLLNIDIDNLTNKTNHNSNTSTYAALNNINKFVGVNNITNKNINNHYPVNINTSANQRVQFQSNVPPNNFNVNNNNTNHSNRFNQPQNNNYSNNNLLENQINQSNYPASNNISRSFTNKPTNTYNATSNISVNPNVHQSTAGANFYSNNNSTNATTIVSNNQNTNNFQSSDSNNIGSTNLTSNNNNFSSKSIANTTPNRSSFSYVSSIYNPSTLSNNSYNLNSSILNTNKENNKPSNNINSITNNVNNNNNRDYTFLRPDSHPSLYNRTPTPYAHATNISNNLNSNNSNITPNINPTGYKTSSTNPINSLSYSTPQNEQKVPLQQLANSLQPQQHSNVASFNNIPNVLNPASNRGFALNSSKSELSLTGPSSQLLQHQNPQSIQSFVSPQKPNINLAITSSPSTNKSPFQYPNAPIQSNNNSNANNSNNATSWYNKQNTPTVTTPTANIYTNNNNRNSTNFNNSHTGSLTNLSINNPANSNNNPTNSNNLSSSTSNRAAFNYPSAPKLANTNNEHSNTNNSSFSTPQKIRQESLDSFVNTCKQLSNNNNNNVVFHKPNVPEHTLDELKSICTRYNEQIVRNVSIDYNTIGTWIYPGEESTVRGYQYQIAQQSLYYNTLVCLPTGLGKTFIAAVTMYNYYRWYPNGKVVFCAPTKPLVTQQINACCNIMGINRDHTIAMTGLMNQRDRRIGWKNHRIIFTTPQAMKSDIERDAVPLKEVVCIVIDEAHRAVGNYAYVTVIQQLSQQSTQFRVLGLSATPGSNLSAVNKIVENLKISHLEVRQDTDHDIKKYVHERKSEIITVNSEGLIGNLEDQYMALIAKPYKKLVESFKVIKPYPIDTLQRFLLIQELNAFKNNPPKHIPPDQVYHVTGEFGLLISLVEGRKKLKYGIETFYVYLQDLFSENKPQTHAKRYFKQSFPFKNFMNTLQQARMTTDVHPKLRKLEQIVKEHFEKQKNANNTNRMNGNNNYDENNDLLDEDDTIRIDGSCIIFTEYRDSVNEIVSALKKYNTKEHDYLIKPIELIGQSSGTKSASKPKKKKNNIDANDNDNNTNTATKSKFKRARVGGGLTQTQQMQALNNFREGVYNTLVATCIGEEGLDIGQVDLIISYDALASNLRIIQRFGRTGRQRAGRCITLLQEGEECRKYNNTIQKGVNLFKQLKSAHKTNSINFYKQNPRMIPDGVIPKLQFKKIDKIDSPTNHTTSNKKKNKNKITNNEVTQLTKPLSEKETNSMQSLSLDNNIDSQKILKPIKNIDHSIKTKIFVTTLQQLQSLQEVAMKNKSLEGYIGGEFVADMDEKELLSDELVKIFDESSIDYASTLHNNKSWDNDNNNNSSNNNAEHNQVVILDDTYPIDNFNDNDLSAQVIENKQSNNNQQSPVSFNFDPQTEQKELTSSSKKRLSSEIDAIKDEDSTVQTIEQLFNQQSAKQQQVQSMNKRAKISIDLLNSQSESIPITDNIRNEIDMENKYNCESKNVIQQEVDPWIYACKSPNSLLHFDLSKLNINTTNNNNKDDFDTFYKAIIQIEQQAETYIQNHNRYQNSST